MRSALSAISSASIGVFALGVISTVNVVALAQQPAVVPYGVYISEVSTVGVNPNAAFKEFIEIANRGPRNVAIGGFQVVAGIGTSPSGPTLEIARIPDYTVLEPGEAYLLASSRFTGPMVPDQIFQVEQDIPDQTGLALISRTGEVVDVVGTTYATQFRAGTPAAPLAASDGAARLSLHRVAFTGNNRTDFAKQRVTPGVPNAVTRN